MEPKLNLSGISTIGDEDDHMGGYEFATNPNDTITLSSLNYGHNYPNTITGGGYVSQGYGAVPNVSINGPVYTTSGSLGPFTIGSTGSNTSPWVYNPNPSSKIKLDGAEADIEINGISLLKTMQEIQNRLNLLQPNTYLEAEWEELYALGKKYRELEQQIKDKQATWDRLKAMPLPELD